MMLSQAFQLLQPEAEKTAAAAPSSPASSGEGSSSDVAIAGLRRALKEATAELAGQLGNADRTLDNDVIIQGLTSVKAGSVSLSFKDAIMPQVIPDAVYNLMPQSWLTDELYLPANAAQFDVVSEASPRWPA